MDPAHAAQKTLLDTDTEILKELPFRKLGQLCKDARIELGRTKAEQLAILLSWKESRLLQTRRARDTSTSSNNSDSAALSTADARVRLDDLPLEDVDEPDEEARESEISGESTLRSQSGEELYNDKVDDDDDLAFVGSSSVPSRYSILSAEWKEMLAVSKSLDRMQRIK